MAKVLKILVVVAEPGANPKSEGVRFVILGDPERDRDERAYARYVEIMGEHAFPRDQVEILLLRPFYVNG